MVVNHPPQLNLSFVLRKRFRFLAAAAGTTALTALGLGDLWCVAATTTSAYQLAHFVRLRKVEMWGPMSSSLAPVQVLIDWTGSTTAGVFGKSNRVEDLSMGSTECAHVVSKPPAGSQISQWIASNSNSQLCNLSYPINAVIDITYELVVRDDGSAVAVTGAVAGAVVGANYIRSLDSPSAVNLPPVGYSTI